jgi:DNA-binding MurR/RpiR family transcriptional regulator
MPKTSIADRLIGLFDQLPAQHRVAARWLIDHPDDVALLSMREQAKRAGVPPATMTRLAQRLGFDGFDGLRDVYAATLRGRADDFRGRTEELQARRELDGDEALTSDILAGLSGHLRAMSDAKSLRAISEAADIIAGRDRLYCIGARSIFVGAYLGAYLLALVGEKTVLVDAPGEIGFDRLREIGRRDAVLALSIEPYVAATADAVAFGRERGAAIIAVTDSPVAAIARHAATCVIVPTATASFLQTVAPALIAVECIAALVAARRGKRALAAIADTESHLDRFGIYLPARTKARKRG